MRATNMFTIEPGDDVRARRTLPTERVAESIHVTVFGDGRALDLFIETTADTARAFAEAILAALPSPAASNMVGTSREESRS